jgi:hypothetical protein
VSALAGAAIMLGGCGGSSRLSAAQFAAKADAACQATDARLAALATPASLPQLAGYAASTRAATEQLHDALSKLDPPAADSAAMTRYLAALAKGEGLLKGIASAAAAGQRSSVSSLGGELARLPTGTLASGLGLATCAKPTAQS